MTLVTMHSRKWWLRYFLWLFKKRFMLCDITIVWLLWDTMGRESFQRGLMPCPFTSPKMFWAGPKVYLHFVVITNILCQTKRWFAFSKIGFFADTKDFEEALNAVKLLGWIKKFGPAKEQVINVNYIIQIQ